MLDLFGDNYQHASEFCWVVAMFAAGGATEAIKRASDIPLKTYYPIRFNGKGEPIPLWRNYLFLEYRGVITLDICRDTQKFIKVLSMRDDEGELYPVMVRKNAIDENLSLLVSGKFNDKLPKRRHYYRGSMVRVTDGTFLDKRVRLEMDIPSCLPGNRKVMININGIKGSIELWKLSL